MIDVTEIERTADRIAPYLLRTPTMPSPGLTELIGAPTTVKLEALQLTGSFKARGATSKLLALTAAEREAGVVAMSGGNHAIGVAVMAGILEVEATVVMPRTAPRDSISRSRAAGARVELTEGIPEAFALVERLRAEGRTLLHPFDDPQVIAGQGTVGLEVAEDADELTDVLVSVGGGGLISGVAVALRARRPGIRIWGVETVGAQAMTDALAAGGPTDTELSSIVTTLSAPKVSATTYEHVAELVSGVLSVSDAEAVQGTLAIADRAKVWVEPAEGCLLPAARQVVDRVGHDVRLGLVLAGGNASTADVYRWAGEFGLLD
jgi:threonine dehydratase